MGLRHPHRTDISHVRSEYFEAAEVVGDTWAQLRREAKRTLEAEPSLDALLGAVIFERASLASSSASIIARLVAEDEREREIHSSLVAGILAENQRLTHFACLDLRASQRAGQAGATALRTYLFSPGFHALQCHRVCHWLWKRGRSEIALRLQAAARRRSGVGIHPSAEIGHGVVLDDGGAISVGENCSIGNDVRLGAGVLVCRSDVAPGSAGPRLSDAVTLRAGARVIGAVSLGAGCVVREATDVLEDVAPFAVVEGVAARIAGHGQARDSFARVPT